MTATYRELRELRERYEPLIAEAMKRKDGSESVLQNGIGYLALEIAEILHVATHFSWLLRGKDHSRPRSLSLKVQCLSLADLPFMEPSSASHV
jgi:hypothetical protein